MDETDRQLNIRSCVSRALDLSNRLRVYAVEHGATEDEADKLWGVADSVFRILLWQMEDGAVAKKTSHAIGLMRLCEIGVATMALDIYTIPVVIRQPLLHLLRPFKDGSPPLRWWDDVAMPKWIEPCFSLMERDGSFDELMGSALAKG